MTTNRGYYVYKLFGEDRKLLYIGKSVELRSRISDHLKTDSDILTEITSVEYTELESEQDMDFLEHYLISKESPELNKTWNNQRFKKISFSLEEAVKWERFDHKELIVSLMRSTNHMKTNKFYCNKLEKVYTLEKRSILPLKEDRGTTFLIKGDKGYATNKKDGYGGYRLTDNKLEARRFRRFENTIQFLSALDKSHSLEVYEDGFIQEKIRLPKEFYKDVSKFIAQ